MPRGRYVRLKTRLPDAATAARYLLYWQSTDLYHHAEDFPQLDSISLFGNQHPLELEVGCGTGEFLCTLAARTPQTNYVGVDLARKAVFLAVDNAARLGLTNIMFIKADIMLVLPLLVPESLQSVYLHFPAPHIQARHRRRGILSQRFVDGIYRALVINGRLSIMTDQPAVVCQIGNLTRDDRRFETVREEEAMPEMDAALKSKYQQMWERKGRAFERLEVYKRSLLALLLCVVTGLALVACSTPGASEQTVVPTATPTPRELSQQVGAATLAVQSMHFGIEVSGAPVPAEPSGFFALVSMEGDMQRPDGVMATVKVKSITGVAEVRVVSLAGQQYVTNPITRQWMCVPPGVAFDPAILFDPQVGMEQLLQTDIEDVTLVGIEDLDGRPHYHLRGTVPGERLQAISYGTLGAGAVTADLWAEMDTLRATRVVLVDTSTDANRPSTWSMQFSEYDKDVDLRVPPGVDC